MTVSAPFRGLGLVESEKRVRKLEGFCEEIAAGKTLTDISNSSKINIYQLRNAISAYNSYVNTLIKLKESGYPKSHLSHLKDVGFDEEQMTTIKHITLAKAMVGVPIQKALVQTETQQEKAICSAVDYEYLTNGTIPAHYYRTQSYLNPTPVMTSTTAIWYTLTDLLIVNWRVQRPSWPCLVMEQEGHRRKPLRWSQAGHLSKFGAVKLSLKSEMVGDSDKGLQRVSSEVSS